MEKNQIVRTKTLSELELEENVIINSKTKNCVNVTFSNGDKSALMLSDLGTAVKVLDVGGGLMNNYIYVKSIDDEGTFFIHSGFTKEEN